MHDISGKRIAILATTGFEQSELTEPLRQLREAGAQVEIVSPKTGSIRGWQTDDWGDSVAVDRALETAAADDYDALVLPGGQINPDLLRLEPKAVDFVRAMVASGKLVAAVCHAPWLLIEAKVIKGRPATSYASIRTDLENAGAQWRDEAVVSDGEIITSRNPGDLDAFCAAIAENLAKREAKQRSAA